MITEANVTVMVTDIDRAVLFYTETLGLTLKARYGKEFAELQAPGLNVALHPVPNPPRGTKGNETLSIGIGVDGLDRTMEELKKKGIRFERIAEDGPVRLAFFSDPDGNPLYLAETRRGSR